MGDSLTQLYTDLDDIRQARRDALKAGKSLNIPGSFNVTQYDLKELRREEARILKRIRRLQGIPPQSSYAYNSDRDLTDFREGGYE